MQNQPQSGINRRRTKLRNNLEQHEDSPWSICRPSGADMNQYLVTLNGPRGTIEVTIGAMDPYQAARAAEGMYPGSRAVRILKVAGA